MLQWSNLQGVHPKKFVCGFCGNLVASAQGFFTNSSPQAFLFICPNCGSPSFFGPKGQLPGVAPGNDVGHLPSAIEALYREARQCVAVGSHTSAVLASRKLLMHVAVAQGAKEGETFLTYVNYLADKGFVPPNGRGWVDHIRSKGNEANHEIRLMSQPDAEELISFLEMLLKFIYEFPNRVPVKKP